MLKNAECAGTLGIEPGAYSLQPIAYSQSPLLPSSAHTHSEFRRDIAGESLYELLITTRCASFLLCPVILATLAGCASRVAQQEAEKAAVRRNMEQLEQEQSKWFVAVNESRERVERLLAAKRQETEDNQRPSGEPILAEMEVIAMARDPQAPFRYRGRVRLQQPAAYQGKEVDGFLLSHERDLTALTGQSITIATHTGSLAQQLEPMGPFSINNHATLAADDHDGKFQPFDEARFAKEIRLSGRIQSFEADPENKVGYFMFDILFSGDVATVEIDSPALYRGTKLRVLVERDAGNASKAWAQVGGEVTFSTAEATVAWEPWGFTRASELKEVSFPLMAVGPAE